VCRTRRPNIPTRSEDKAVVLIAADFGPSEGRWWHCLDSFLIEEQTNERGEGQNK